MFKIIACIDSRGGISKNGSIPWRCAEDMQFFTKTTTANIRNIVIMGRKTWESIPNKPLRGRINIVVSSRPREEIIEDKHSPIHVVKSLDEALASAMSDDETPPIINSAPIESTSIFVIGGARLYEEAINHNKMAGGWINIINHDYNCDNVVDFSRIDAVHFSRSSIYGNATVNGNSCDMEYVTYERKINRGESKYLTLAAKILDCTPHPNRTAVETRSLFSKKLKFNLERDIFSGERIIPLLTTKRISFRIIYEELLWFLRGEDNIDYLREKNVHIWDKNTTAEFLKSRGIENKPAGHTGPIYGVQWRNWGGVDQIANLIHGLKTAPFSRRHVVSAWNVAELDKMCLPPCHLMSIWNVERAGDTQYLSCLVIMRSADMFHGVPYNIASYSILTHIIAELCGMRAKKIAVEMANCHIYESHVECMREQIKRAPWQFPALHFRENTQNMSIDDFNSDSVYISGAKQHPALRAEMVE